MKTNNKNQSQRWYNVCYHREGWISQWTAEVGRYICYYRTQSLEKAIEKVQKEYRREPGYYYGRNPDVIIVSDERWDIGVWQYDVVHIDETIDGVGVCYCGGVSTTEAEFKKQKEAEAQRQYAAECAVRDENSRRHYAERDKQHEAWAREEGKRIVEWYARQNQVQIQNQQ